MNAVFESTVQNMSHFIYFHSYRKILCPKEVLKLYQASSFRVYRLTLIGVNDRRNGNGSDQGEPKDSENKLAVCHGPSTIEIASATAGLFCGTVYPLM